MTNLDARAGTPTWIRPTAAQIAPISRHTSTDADTCRRHVADDAARRRRHRRQRPCRRQRRGLRRKVRAGRRGRHHRRAGRRRRHRRRHGQARHHHGRRPAARGHHPGRIGEGALSSAGLQTGAHDVLAPAADTQIADGSQIALERGRLLSLTINGQRARRLDHRRHRRTRPWSSSARTRPHFELSADRSRRDPARRPGRDGQRAAHRLAVGGRRRRHPGADRCRHRRRCARRPGHHPGRRPTRSTPALTDAVTDGLQITVTQVAVTTVTEHRRVRADRPAGR